MEEEGIDDELGGADEGVVDTVGVGDEEDGLAETVGWTLLEGAGLPEGVGLLLDSGPRG